MKVKVSGTQLGTKDLISSSLSPQTISLSRIVKYRVTPHLDSSGKPLGSRYHSTHWVNQCPLPPGFAVNRILGRIFASERSLDMIYTTCDCVTTIRNSSLGYYRLSAAESFVLSIDYIITFRFPPLRVT